MFIFLSFLIMFSGYVYADDIKVIDNQIIISRVIPKKIIAEKTVDTRITLTELKNKRNEAFNKKIEFERKAKTFETEVLFIDKQINEAIKKGAKEAVIN